MSGKADDVSSLRELRNYIYFIAVSIIPVTAIYVYASLASGSVSIAALMLQCGVSVVANLFTVISIRAMLRKNVFTFPYGTGKLENFIGFMTGTLMLPVSAMIYYSTLNSLLAGRHEVHFAIANLAMVPSLLRDSLLLAWSRNLIKKSVSPSPIVKSFYTSYKVSSIVTLSGICSLLVALWLTRLDHGDMGIMIDLALAFVLATYMATSAVILIRINFRSLIDLPLAEIDQLKIMKVISNYYDLFDNLGTIYTRTCGNTKIIEAELHFNGEAALEHIRLLTVRMNADFAAVFNDFEFRLIPVVNACQVGDYS